LEEASHPTPHPHLNPPPSRERRKKEWIPACTGMTYEEAGRKIVSILLKLNKAYCNIF